MASKEEVQARLDEQRAVIDKRNAEAEERMAKSKPTPTQRENDLARLGVLVDKEPDGTPEEDPTVTKAMEPAPPDPAYVTRSMKKKSD